MDVTHKLYWHSRFLQAGGDNQFLFNFDLNQDSVVFDIGSYDGEYFQEISRRYSCYIHAFEPVPSFYNYSTRFLPNKIEERDLYKVVINNFALGKVDETFPITLSNNASSAFIKGGEQVNCSKISFANYVQTKNVGRIDLLKVNCEGGEYELLETIIEHDWLSKIDNIIIQFHLIPEIPVEARQTIVDKLAETHDVVFSFPFIWEGWKLKRN